MKLLSVICIPVLLSCNNNSEMQTADTLSVPEDSLAFYFPINSLSKYPNVDSFVQDAYSATLYSFREPCLSQGFVGHSIYRFVWSRSFHRPVVFSFHNKDGRVWLHTKMLDKQPQSYEQRISGVSEEQQDEYIKEGYIVDQNDPELLVKIADRKANIIYNKKITLSDKEWNEFEQLLTKANFWALPTRVDDSSTDGSSWLIEAHSKEKYHLVDYQNAYGYEFSKAGIFLINLSGLKEEIY